MVKRFFENGRRLFFAKQSSILSAAGIMAATYFASATLGLIRDRLLAHYFGASQELGIYFAADRIPNLIFNLLVIGALSSAFIPVFTRYLSRNGRDGGWPIASAVVNLSLLAFLVVAALVFVFARPLANLLTLRKLGPADLRLMTSLMRVMLGAQGILIVSSFLTSILQSFKRFFVPALTPVLYNLGIIFGTVAFSGRFGIWGPVWGMVLGSVLHLLIQLPTAFALGFRHIWVFDYSHRAVREIGRLALPRTLGLAAVQLGLLVDTALAAFISAPSVVVLNFTLHLGGLPISLFGATIAQAALPTLSSESGERLEEFKKTLLTSLHQMMFLIIPASVILLVLRIPAVRLVFGAARFSWEATVATAYTLAFFALSIFAQGAVYLLARAFFALRDTRTPVRASLFAVLLNVSLSVTFVRFLGWGVWSLGLACSAASFLNALCLLVLLDRRVGRFDRRRLLEPFLKIAYASLLMGIALFVPMKLLDRWVFDTTRVINLMSLTGLVTVCGSAVYLGLTKLMRLEEVEMFWNILGRTSTRLLKSRPER